MSLRFEPDSYNHGFGYYLMFDATTDSEWYPDRPDSFRYKSGELYFYKDKIVTVNLVDMTVQDENASVDLTAEWLARWITDMDSPPQELVDECGEIIGMFHKAADGSLRRPNHHGYHFEDHLGWRMVHFALGGGFWMPLFLPTIVLLLVAMLLKHLGRRSSQSIDITD